MDLQAFLSLNTLPHTLFSLTSCISIVCSVLNILAHLTAMLPVGPFNVGRTHCDRQVKNCRYQSGVLLTTSPGRATLGVRSKYKTKLHTFLKKMIYFIVVDQPTHEIKNI